MGDRVAEFEYAFEGPTKLISQQIERVINFSDRLMDELKKNHKDNTGEEYDGDPNIHPPVRLFVMSRASSLPPVWVLARMMLCVPYGAEYTSLNHVYATLATEPADIPRPYRCTNTACKTNRKTCEDFKPGMKCFYAEGQKKASKNPAEWCGGDLIPLVASADEEPTLKPTSEEGAPLGATAVDLFRQRLRHLQEANEI